MRNILCPLLLLALIVFAPAAEKENNSRCDYAIMVKKLDFEPPMIIKYVWAGDMKHDDFC